MAVVQRAIKEGCLSLKYIVIENHPADSRVKIKDDGICQSLTSRMGTGGGNVPLILAIHEADGQDVTMMEETAYALVTSGGKPGQGYPCVLILNDQGDQQISCEKYEISPCLRAQDHGHPPIVIYETDNTNSD